MRVLIVAVALVAITTAPAVAGRDAPILDRLLAPHGQLADSGSCAYRCQSRYSNCTSNCRNASCRSSCSARYSSCLTNCTTRN